MLLLIIFYCVLQRSIQKRAKILSRFGCKRLGREAIEMPHMSISIQNPEDPVKTRKEVARKERANNHTERNSKRNDGNLCHW